MPLPDHHRNSLLCFPSFLIGGGGFFVAKREFWGGAVLIKIVKAASEKSELLQFARRSIHQGKGLAGGKPGFSPDRMGVTGGKPVGVSPQLPTLYTEQAT
jgi:hypothetical protein